MYKNELWQTYNKFLNPIEGVGRDAKLGNPKNDETDIICVACVWLYRFNEAGRLEFLAQKRSQYVDRNPGKWDVSAGGHINLGETVEEGALREMKEEIGAIASEDELNVLCVYPRNNTAFNYCYTCDYTGKNEDFHFDDQEVEEVKWVPVEGLDDFWENDAKEPLKNDKAVYHHLKSFFERAQENKKEQ